jgi:hypothetical protein
MNENGERMASCFVKMDANATRLGTRGLKDEYRFVLELLAFSGNGLKANKDVKGQEETSQIRGYSCKVGGSVPPSFVLAQTKFGASNRYEASS